MENHYQILGLNSSATAAEIRRAYRVLARRYHPDVNPGHASGEKFKLIAAAYDILSDPEKRTTYDRNLDSELRQRLHRGAFENYERAQQRANAARKQADAARARRGGAKPKPSRPEPKSKPSPPGVVAAGLTRLRAVVDLFQFPKRQGVQRRTTETVSDSREETRVEQVSLIEVSVSIRDAVYGIKKTVEVPEPSGDRKISVTIPPGVRNGSVVRMRGKSNPGEDVVLIVRVAAHPYLSIHTRGLVAEIPVTVSEALYGASVSVPTLEEPAIIKIPPASQSGSEIRIKGKGVFNRDGTRGDLFVRLLVALPESPDAVGLKERADALEQYYGSPVRQRLAKTLLE